LWPPTSSIVAPGNAHLVDPATAAERRDRPSAAWEHCGRVFFLLRLADLFQLAGSSRNLVTAFACDAGRQSVGAVGVLRHGFVDAELAYDGAPW
jgi:hypothetical protein